MEKPSLKPGENKVTYLSDGKKLSALLYLPKDYKKGEKKPAIVITRPATGVKEQTAGLYAQKLSQKGFITIAFDPKGFGESEGRPQDENPLSIISDTKNTREFLRSLPQVDLDKIFHMGICMGSAYATWAAAKDERIKGVATVSPYLTGHIDYPKALGNLFMRITNWMIRRRRKTTDETGKHFFMGAVPETWFQMRMPHTKVAEGMREYYLPDKPGDVPNWKNKANMYSAKDLIQFNAYDILDKYKDIPFLMAYGTRGYSPELLQKFYDSICTDEKELLVLDAGHFDLYYKPEYVKPIVERITAFFKKQIKLD